MGTTWTWRGSSPWSTRPCLARPTRGTRSCLHAVPGGTTPGRAGPASGTGSRRAASAVVSAVTVTCARGASSGSVGGSGRPRSVPFSLRALQRVTGARGRPYPAAARTAAFPPSVELPVCPRRFPLAPTCTVLATAGPVRGSGRTGAAGTARRADDAISVPRWSSCGGGGRGTLTDFPCAGASFGVLRSAPPASVCASDAGTGPSRVSAPSPALPFPLGGRCMGTRAAGIDPDELEALAEEARAEDTAAARPARGSAVAQGSRAGWRRGAGSSSSGEGRRSRGCPAIRAHGTEAGSSVATAVTDATRNSKGSHRGGRTARSRIECRADSLDT